MGLRRIGTALYSELPFASPDRIWLGERGPNLHEVSGLSALGGPRQANEVNQGDWGRDAL
jgi:hypothetical protein